MIHEYMPADPLMALAWRDCLRWAITYPPILDAFLVDTGVKVAPLTTAMDRMICEATGEGEAVARQFVKWFNVNIWGKTMDGKISICRDNHDTIRLYLTDNTSGERFLEVTMTAEALGLAITGLSFQPCAFELHAEHVGKVREFKKERVPFPLTYGKTDIVSKSMALAPFEVDGWVGYPADLGNHHKGNSEKGYLVTFTRFVENKEAK